MADLKSHWNKIYKTKSKDQVSWTQRVPETSLAFVHDFSVSKSAAIIDVGGGESNFVDYLLEEGFSNITILDISEEAIRKTQERLGTKGANIKWVVSDVTEFHPTEKYDLWHDRATFHFLTEVKQIETYVDLASQSIVDGGYMTIGTFSTNGPTKCSGLEIKQYDETDLERTMTYHFKKIKCKTEDHITPFQTIQNFLFCSFKKAA